MVRQWNRFPREAVESPPLEVSERRRCWVRTERPSGHGGGAGTLPLSRSRPCPPGPARPPAPGQPHGTTPGEERPGRRRGPAAEGLNRGSPGAAPAPPRPLPGHARPAPAAASSPCAVSGAGRRRPALSAAAAPGGSRRQARARRCPQRGEQGLRGARGEPEGSPRGARAPAALRGRCVRGGPAPENSRAQRSLSPGQRREGRGVSA